MITHIVLFELASPSRENTDETAAILRSMEGRIPELASIEVGADELSTPRSFHLALTTRHESWAAYETYQAHPIHQEVLAHMKRVISRAVAVDYER